MTSLIASYNHIIGTTLLNITNYKSIFIVLGHSSNDDTVIIASHSVASFQSSNNISSQFNDIMIIIAMVCFDWAQWSMCILVLVKGRQ